MLTNLEKNYGIPYRSNKVMKKDIIDYIKKKGGNPNLLKETDTMFIYPGRFWWKPQPKGKKSKPIWEQKSL